MQESPFFISFFVKSVIKVKTLKPLILLGFWHVTHGFDSRTGYCVKAVRNLILTAFFVAPEVMKNRGVIKSVINYMF